MEKDREKMMIIEAALFLAGRGMRLKELCRAAGTTPAHTRKLLDETISEFGQNSALEIIFEDDLYKMKIRDRYLPKVKEMSSLTDILEGDSKTLSIIAYYQPIKQSDIIKIRGNRAYDQIKRLIGRGLVSAEEKGKTKLLVVTTKFREYFGNQIDEFRRQIETGELKNDIMEEENVQGTEQPVLPGDSEAAPEAPAGED